jgi:hypothetical protein
MWQVKNVLWNLETEVESIKISIFEFLTYGDIFVLFLLVRHGMTLRQISEFSKSKYEDS